MAGDASPDGWLGHRIASIGNRVASVIHRSRAGGAPSVFAPVGANIPENFNDILPLLVSWETLYSKHLGKEYDFTNVVVPPKREGFDRLIVIPQGITNMELWACLKKLMPCYSWYTDLNAITSVRTTKSPTLSGYGTGWRRTRSGRTTPRMTLWRRT